jgi:hypothetical protein
MGSPTWEFLYGHVHPRPVKYTRSIVTYLDILGFRNLIDTKTAGEISQILRILTESVKPGETSKLEGLRFTKFSDTVIRSTPVGKHFPHDFIFELRTILYAQIALIPREILVRGAVTIGDCVQSWRRVYGRAVARAYDLAEREGEPPRIVIDEEALAHVRPALTNEGLGSELDGLVRKEGTTTYLNYLKACEAELFVPEQEYPMFLKLHRDLIRKGLSTYAAKPRVLEKYEWLRNYHERTLQEQFGAEIPRHLRV